MADRTNTLLAIRGRITRDQADAIRELTGFDPVAPDWEEGTPTASDWHDDLVEIGVDYCFLFDARFEWDSGAELYDATAREARTITTTINHSMALVPLDLDPAGAAMIRRWEAFLKDFPTDGSGVAIVDGPADPDEPEARSFRFVARVPATVEIAIEAASHEAAREVWRTRLAGASLVLEDDTSVIKPAGATAEDVWKIGPVVPGLVFGPAWPAPEFVLDAPADIVFCESCGEESGAAPDRRGGALRRLRLPRGGDPDGGRGMKTFHVRWEIGIDADTAEEAAARALIVQRDADPENAATVFDVTGPDGACVVVDLDCEADDVARAAGPGPDSEPDQENR